MVLTVGIGWFTLTGLLMGWWPGGGPKRPRRWKSRTVCSNLELKGTKAALQGAAVAMAWLAGYPSSSLPDPPGPLEESKPTTGDVDWNAEERKSD
jgi:hypothetical protein